MIEADDLQSSGPQLRIAQPGDGAAMLRIIRAAFQARPALDPPADALTDSLDDIERRIADQVGIIASEDGEDVGCLFVSFEPTDTPPSGMLHRVSVLPSSRLHGVAETMVRAAADLAGQAGMRRMKLVARRELPAVIGWWAGRDFLPVGVIDDHRLLLAGPLPARFVVPTAEAMHALGARLAALLAPGDVIVASGELGAGKTTLTQGIGAGLHVTGPITSPTFVLSRIHPAAGQRPQLVHVDAYRLGSAAEVDDLDLDASLADSVTLVEWGAGVAEHLSDDRLEIDIERSDDVDDDTRLVTMRGLGARWRDVDLWALAEENQEA